MPEKPKTNDELELRIDSLAFGGRGVARTDGFVIFVEGALPGDLVRARVTRSRRSYAEARTVAVLEASAARVEPRCRHFGICGGCSWQSLAYETQLEYKQSQVNECLSHIGGLSGFETEPPVGAEPLWRYRNKVEYSFAGEDGVVNLGFHLPGQWRRILDIEDCLLHSEATNRIRDRIREFARASGVAVFDQNSGRGFWRHLTLREAARTGEIMVNIVTAPGEFPGADELSRQLMGEFPRIASLLWSVNETRAAVATGFPFRVLAGRDHITEEVCGLKLAVTPSSFLQTNTAMAERLYEKALEFAEPGGDELVFDLYSGIGSIALVFARRCREVFGIEIVDEAAQQATENARANGLGNATFRQGKVRSALKQIVEPAGNAVPAVLPQIVILDPPRAGASKKEVQRILKLEARRLVYVSCNASTMAANAAQLRQGGYRLTRVAAIDMFPHTPHIETVARFERD